ncbi:hypothetical protein RISK_002206 [Rhodopirellula islandica]|uniref:Uncharacterized protein n=1 Tax=Rhodopirellula islandica TaxID=595434 RepID=A0A0J1EJ64_RHOIS|nr:hypothetical protein RISK_002206 [Rhodopirellula islandica]
MWAQESLGNGCYPTAVTFDLAIHSLGNSNEHSNNHPPTARRT